MNGRALSEALLRTACRRRPGVCEEEESIFFAGISSDVLYDDRLARLLTFPHAMILHAMHSPRVGEIAHPTGPNTLALSLANRYSWKVQF